jgi:MoaA/NifB/PqqE/SkfB family radical SAM enzyme
LDPRRVITQVRKVQRRVAGRPWSRQAYYVLNTFIGETLRTRTIGTLGLRLVGIDLTDRCQCGCVHCYAAKPAAECAELTVDEVRSVIDQAAAMRATEVSFSGGEPLLHKDAVDLVRYAHRKGMVSKINTNGVLLSRDRIHALQEAGLNWCAVSLDSARPHVHDELRKFPGCCNRVIDGLKMLVECGIPCSITTYVTKQDVYTDHLSEIVALGHTLGVSQVRINFPVPMGRFEDRQDLVLTHEEREEIRKLLRDEIVSMEAPRAGTRCTAGVTTLTVKANGDVTPCVFVPLPYGNIRSHSLREIWRAMAEFDRMHKPDGQCPYSEPAFRERMWKLDESARIGATQ